jgi:hypothetical protein
MIQLLAKKQDGTRLVELDLLNPGELSFDYEAADFLNASARRASFSKEFTLPRSNTNAQFFGHFDDQSIAHASGTTLFDARYRAAAEIRVEGIAVLQGYLQLRSYDSLSDTYTAAVFGNEASLFNALGTRKLRDILIFSNGNLDGELDHDLTPQNVIDSFDVTNDITADSVGAGTVMYYIADYGTVGENNFLYGDSSGSGFSGIFTANFLNSYNFRPALKIDYLFRKVLKRAGYSLADTTFLSSDAWTKLYMTMGGGGAPVTDGFLGILVASNVTDMLTLAYNETAQIIPFNIDSGSGINNQPFITYDLGGNYDTSNYAYTAPYDGVYSGQLVVTIDTSLAGPETFAQGYLYLGVFTGGNNGDINNYTLPTQDDLYTITMEWSIEAQAGQAIFPYLQFFGQVVNATITVKGQNSYWLISGASTQAGYVRMSQNLPDISQAAFVRDIVQRFNLTLIADKDNPRLIHVEPYNDFFEGDTAIKDWTEKLDVSKNERTEPTHSLMKQYIDFSDLDDPSYYNALSKQNTGETYGRYYEERTEHFVTGTLKNDAVFAPLQIAPVPKPNAVDETVNGNYVIPIEYTSDFNPATQNKPKLMYLNDMATLATPIFVDDLQTQDPPLFLPYLGVNGILLNNSPLLSWTNGKPLNLPLQLTYGQPQSDAGYFSLYWADFLRPIYDVDARLYTAYFYLEAGDIYDFAFSNRIQVRNQQYRVIKIQGYQPQSGGTIKVTMLKLLEPRQGITLAPTIVLDEPITDLCSLTVSAIGAGGEVTFVDADGNTTAATEACCNANGYLWNGSKCFDPTYSVPSPNTTSGGGFSNIGPTRFRTGLTSKTGKLAKDHFKGQAGQIAVASENKSAFTQSTTQNFVYQCVSTSTSYTQASLSGRETDDGSILLPPDCMARVTVSASSTQVNQYSTKASDVGSVSFLTYSFIAKNLGGTLTVTNAGGGTGEVRDYTAEDSAASGRQVRLNKVAGEGGKSYSEYLSIECKSESDLVTAAWVLDVSITFVSFARAKDSFANTLIAQNGDNLLTENSELIDHQA